MGTVFQQDDLDELTRHYPLSSVGFTHALQSHPLLGLDALAVAANDLNPADVERRMSDGDVGSEFTKIEQHQLPVDEHIRSIDKHSGWIMLARIEQLPAYRALIAEILECAGPLLEARTGKLCDPVGFLFISARQSITPFHFDPEYNLFFQISGRKSFTTFPAAPPFITDAVNEEYHYGGNNMLRWQDEFRALGTSHELAPGSGLYVPYKTPHWVEVGDQLSVSLSITWKSPWAIEQEYGHRWNAKLRQWGLAPRPLAPWPARAMAKATGARILARTGQMR